jgi:hypothetical protein
LLHLQQIKLRHGGVTVLTMSIEIEERRFGIILDGTPYPPILSVDDNFETALSCSHDGRHGLAKVF